MSEKTKSSVPTAKPAKEDGDELAKEGNALSENELDKVVGGGTFAFPPPDDGLLPMEQISLNFTKMTQDYTKQSGGGSGGGGNVSVGYDLSKSAKT